MYFQHLCTNNDRNGNPRRLYVLINEGQRVAAWDEGYLGHHAVPGIWRDAAYDAERIDITPKLYYDLLRMLPSPANAYDVPGFSFIKELIND